MDKDEIIQLYLGEAFEKVEELSNEMIELEKNPENPEIIQTIFRCAHTLKGNSTTVYNTVLDIDPDELTLPNIDKVSKITHAMENLIMEVRDNGLKLTEKRIDLLFETEEVIEQLLIFIESGVDDDFPVESLHNQLKDSAENKSESVNNPIPKNTDSVSHEGTEFELITNLDEGFKHAYLSLIYRDIEEKYPDITFSPTFDDLMEGKDFSNVSISLTQEINITEAITFIEAIDNVEKLIPSKNDSSAKFEKEFTPINENNFILEEAKELVLKPEFDSKVFVKIQHNTESNPEIKIESSIQPTPLENITLELSDKPETKIEKSQENISEEKDKRKPVTHNTSETIKISISRIDEVLKHVSNLVILKNKLLNYTNEKGDNNWKELRDLSDTAEEISQSVEFLQESVMNIRMTPLDQLFGRFPKDVRRIAKDSNKKVKFETFGGKTEIDKSLLDKLGDPLIHLIRNSVDHGIELPEVREKAGKDPVGNISVSAKHEQNMVVITIEDDGGGIDVQKVVNKAIQRGVITEEKARTTSHKELLNLIFSPGLSTADKVTSISGRGVGMDVVRSKIADDMKGQIEIESEKGIGTKIIIRLPLTLAIINAMLTKISGEVFAFPSSQVESVEEIKVSDIKYITNKEIYILKEKNIEVPIIRLDKFFKLEKKNTDEKTLNLLILKSGTKTIGATVDEFIGHEDIVLKTIGKYLGNISGIGGCNVLGNGDISLIVDVHSIVSNM